MYFTVYKITNKLDNKSYIGKHQTKNLNDGYMGSGKLLKRAIFKYGIENFNKEILFVFDNEADMNAKEKELVQVNESTYNLCEGGKGGFSYINNNGLTGDGNLYRSKKLKENPEFKAKVNANISAALKVSKKNKLAREKAKLILKQKYPGGTFLGKQHSSAAKKKISEANKIASAGKKNSQYGTMWVTNGNINKKIKKEDIDIWTKLGFYRGRKYE